MALTTERKKEISAQVDKILNDFGYNPEVDTYVDSVRLANSLKFSVGEAKGLKENEDGFIIMYNGSRLIGVNIKRSVEDKRFTTAHELGHYVLHGKQLEENMMMREHVDAKTGNQEEDEADFFAACALMPEQSFKREAERLRTSKVNENDIIAVLRILFKVPEESIRRRLQEVGI
ncbi:MAG: ImmA/IrrE family metallo-endopeptidase [Oscillospiraceae bacterium]|nr:ImmA/IrrE family metallo-endopeptidase [Oscillospiraceae bacterium]